MLQMILLNGFPRGPLWQRRVINVVVKILISVTAIWRCNNTIAIKICSGLSSGPCCYPLHSLACIKYGCTTKYISYYDTFIPSSRWCTYVHGFADLNWVGQILVKRVWYDWLCLSGECFVSSTSEASPCLWTRQNNTTEGSLGLLLVYLCCNLFAQINSSQWSCANLLCWRGPEKRRHSLFSAFSLEYFRWTASFAMQHGM